MHDTLPLLTETDFPPVTRGPLKTLQINLGYRCNQSCRHCHVNAGPRRTEQMSFETINQVLEFLSPRPDCTLDLTGGAPEMNPHFRYLVSQARQLGIAVKDRCNLTILQEPGQEGLDAFLAEHRVEIIASLPCYLEDNVNAQRGNGVFEKSITALRQLNALGYGQPGSGLTLRLVYNPQGPSLPPPQAVLEADYKGHLWENYGIRFNQLLTITNMPIARFGSTLISRGEFDVYLALLKASHRPENLDSVMCRELISIDWQGYVYDCDFNQMLGLPCISDKQHKLHLTDINQGVRLGSRVLVADHCYGCTAGQGSSCQGAFSQS